MKKFLKSFTQQEAIPEVGIQAAIEVMRSGRLHRYNVADGEVGETALLESEFAAYMDQSYCLACASGGYALYIALLSVGIAPGDKVLTNAFTLSPVPGAIHNAAGEVVLVNSGEDYKIDCQDFERAAQQSGARFFVLSHMRGHIANMDALMTTCQRHNIVMIEDCAHTMGARWRGRLSGSFGKVACFSTQTYKHINSGEGGLLVTDDEATIKRAIIYSGSYMLYAQHQAAPPADTFADTRLDTPNYSGRMDHLRAAILRPQLRQLESQCQRWNTLYRALEKSLRSIDKVRIPVRPAHEGYVGSSIQFSLPKLSADGIRQFIAAAADRGVVVKWFGDAQPQGYTSCHQSWRYFQNSRNLDATDALLSTLCDMRIPLTFDLDDCALIAAIISDILHGINPH